MSNKPTKEDLQFLDLSLSKEDAAIAEAARKNLMRVLEHAARNKPQRNTNAIPGAFDAS